MHSRSIRLISLLAALSVLAVLVAAGASARSSVHGQAQAQVTVFAAASLTDVFPAIDSSQKYSFGGSNALATQITKGTATPPQGGVDHFEITATYHGPAFQISDMRGVLHARLLLAHTPIDEQSLDLRFAVALERSGPRTETFAKFYVDNLRLGFHEDIAIWEHKVFRDRPQLVAEDGPVGRLRQWYRQFYEPRGAVT